MLRRFAMIMLVLTLAMGFGPRGVMAAERGESMTTSRPHSDADCETMSCCPMMSAACDLDCHQCARTLAAIAPLAHPASVPRLALVQTQPHRIISMAWAPEPPPPRA